MHKKSLLHTILIATLLPFTFLGCFEKVRYVKTPCAKLQIFARDKNETKVLYQGLELDVPTNQQTVTVQFADLVAIAVLMQEVKRVGKSLLEDVELYEKMIEEYNSKK